MLKAIVRPVSLSMNDCELTHLERQPININLAQEQHDAYIRLLSECGCHILGARPEPELPDSVFVEDTAVVLPELAIITHPGAVSRKAECISIAEILQPFRPLYYLDQSYHLDGGDVLVIEKNIFIGLSSRTDQGAIQWIQKLLAPQGYLVKAVPIKECLHLKSAVTYLGNDQVLINHNWVDTSFFQDYKSITVHPKEPGGANALTLGSRTIYSQAYPRTAEKMNQAGLEVKLVDNSEMIKAEGAVTCCSIVFN